MLTIQKKVIKLYWYHKPLRHRLVAV
uniref:Uncharacterized protein n=1 Tax=Rhizophora mucronata TaxID=61149 RepID=A0A2P2N838_RHIMU